jgi:hypothetical protein
MITAPRNRFRVLLACLAAAAALATAPAQADDAAPAEDLVLSARFAAPVGAAIAEVGLTQTETAGEGELRTPESYHMKYRFWRTAADALTANYVIWAFNRYIREGGENPEFRVSWDSIHENLKAGFEWDDNNFSTNHFLHPYHGSLYMTGARANGYTFWQSIPWVWMGSWHWEYMGEVNHGSINDWVNTSMGGIALGEALTRLAAMITDNERRNGRGSRELAGFLVAPVRGFNRMLTGEAFAVHQNPPDRYPDHGGMYFDAGLRALGEERLWRASSTKAFIRFGANYGDPFNEPMEKPFDHFDFGIHINFDNAPHHIAQIKGVGYLYGGEVRRTERTQHILAAFQHFDYVDNEAFTFGNQAVGASFLSRFVTERGFETRTAVHLNAVVMGAAKSDYFSISGREYDYGPGVGFKFYASFGRDGREYLSLAHASFYIHSVNGNVADHYLQASTARATVPIREFFNFGAEYILYVADRNYRDFPDVYARNPELRAYVSWILGK